MPSKIAAAPGPRKPTLRGLYDDEWGVPVHDDRVFFEFLILKGAGGLSWSTILTSATRLREASRAFDAKVARFDASASRS
jgi:DNA-3-methyladenine glycosylase I